ncbi:MULTISPECIES: sigma-70 family RNA polymerase sigma factor [unclassified Geodermatophilus]|uniref:sigma-70 family RNA polymerase sigma factor n=1 Tax=unclassified Geodermatophilus TaxID=2637632 RepID=UPI003EE88993
MSRPARRAGHGPGDADLLLRVRAGDGAALEELYLRYSRPAFALARRILADDALAEDVLQEVFLGVWRDPAAYDHDRGSLSSWLMGLVHHEAVDAVRREEAHRRRLGRADDPAGEPASGGDVEEDVWGRIVAARVRAALGALPDAQREALTLAYYGGYTQREVAALTRAPLGTVKTRMLAGMRRLREDLGTVAGRSMGGALHDVTHVDGPGR